MPCGETEKRNINRRWDQANECSRILKLFEGNGILPGSDAWNVVYAERGRLMREAGIKVPRIPNLIKLITGLSPGLLRLWWDSELGFQVEVREAPAAPPVLHQISDDEALRLLRETPDADLAHRLIARPEYVGEV
jgi:hypothetical protein